jgi:hypothetical protein
MKNRLRELRAGKEWSQADLAEKLVARLFKQRVEEIFDAEA